ncbi:DUF2958 domain-containing protein [Luteolibacter soli]|uniref:DUF2958 domain-containing protein n=1 Tax=Luteolibacter soli TaxID=3135280 RepID=A0ABU9B2T5_9BACT
MEIITDRIRQKLIVNFTINCERKERGETEIDHWPVVKIFTPDGACTWLLTELDHENDLAFGICDLGLGYPEMGYVSLQELRHLRGGLGLPVERDLHFEATMSLTDYALEALKAERIIV